MRIHRVPLLVAILASLLLTLAGSAQASRLVGSKGSDRIVGTAKADVIKARGGNDRIGGRGGRDRLFGGRGADRLNAADGMRDRVIRGGPGRDVCRIDPTDRAHINGCEIVRIVTRRGPGGGAPGGGPSGPGLPGPGIPGPGGGVPAPGLGCATPPEDARFRPRAAQEDAPPTFSDAFYATTVTLNVSADEMVGDQLVDATGLPVPDPATALLDADTLSLKAQLLPTAQWGTDEDGAPVPTFAVSRADITD